MHGAALFKTFMGFTEPRWYQVSTLSSDLCKCRTREARRNSCLPLSLCLSVPSLPCHFLSVCGNGMECCIYNHKTKTGSNALKAILDASQLSLSVQANLMPAVIRFDMPTPQNKQYFRKRSLFMQHL